MKYENEQAELVAKIVTEAISSFNKSARLMTISRNLTKEQLDDVSYSIGRLNGAIARLKHVRQEASYATTIY